MSRDAIILYSLAALGVSAGGFSDIAGAKLVRTWSWPWAVAGSAASWLCFPVWVMMLRYDSLIGVMVAWDAASVVRAAVIALAYGDGQPSRQWAGLALALAGAWLARGASAS